MDYTKKKKRKEPTVNKIICNQHIPVSSSNIRSRLLHFFSFYRACSSPKNCFIDLCPTYPTPPYSCLKSSTVIYIITTCINAYLTVQLG